MKKYVLFCIFTAWFTHAGAGEIYRGIAFHHGDWDSALAKASREKKLIFIDFYTQWCGPCLNMAEEVFPRSFIGEFYNRHFVNVKIDAEKGEGIELAKRYGVQVFPTFVFVDPADGKAIHRSTSRQSADTFLFTAQSALDPVRRSGYLLESFDKGRRDTAFLLDYIAYQASVYKRDQVRRAFAMLMEQGVSLADPRVWEIFAGQITGADNSWFEGLVADYDRWVVLVGREKVDAKLAAETHNLSPGKLAGFPEFRGKALNMCMAATGAALEQKNYAQADRLLQQAMRDPAIERQEFLSQLKFTLRSSYWAEDTPVEWLGKCAGYLQLIAYQSADRQDASIHYEYALMLERLIRLTPGAEAVFPLSITNAPQKDAKPYSMRPPGLAPKPVKR